jgi:hypothetical protein
MDEVAEHVIEEPVAEMAVMLLLSPSIGATYDQQHEQDPPCRHELTTRFIHISSLNRRLTSMCKPVAALTRQSGTRLLPEAAQISEIARVPFVRFLEPQSTSHSHFQGFTIAFNRIDDRSKPGAGCISRHSSVFEPIRSNTLFMAGSKETSKSNRNCLPFEG